MELSAESLACHTTGNEHFGAEKCLSFQALRALDVGSGAGEGRAELEQRRETEAGGPKWQKR